MASNSSLDRPEYIPKWDRPIRMPKSVPLMHTGPPIAFVGQPRTLRVPFKLSKRISPDTVVKCQLFGGRNNRAVWDGCQVKDPNAPGYVAAELEDGSRLELIADKREGTCTVAVPEGGLAKGDVLTFIVGENGGINMGADRLFNKFMVLYTMPEKDAGGKLPAWVGRGTWELESQPYIVGVCTMHILGGPVERLRAYAPSVVRPGEAFDLLIRPEDAAGVLAGWRPKEVSISNDGNPLKAKIKKVRRSTCLTARVELPEEGLYRLEATDTDGRMAISNPIVCSKTAEPVYWGMIHAHTEMSDGAGTLDEYFHQLRNEVMLDFAASSDHDHLYETPDAYWEVTCETVKRWNDPPEFVVFLGYEWAKWRRNGDGDRNVYYLNDDRPMYRSDEGRYASPPELFRVLRENHEHAIVIPHHTGHAGNFCDWKDHSPVHERLIEIFQVRGSYECSEEDGNPLPENMGNKPPMEVGFVRKALAMGWRSGFTAGGDDHKGHWGTEFLFSLGKTHYKQGLVSVQTPARTREALFEGMYQRRVVATSGGRILLDYELSGYPIGSEVSLKEDASLARRRRVAGTFHGTAPLDHIDVIRNGAVAQTIPGDGKLDLEFEWVDAEALDGIWMPPAPYCEHPFTYYYVRAVQKDGDVAWASPVWVDP